MADTTRKSLLQRAQSSPQDDAWRTLVEMYDPFIESYLRHGSVRDSGRGRHQAGSHGDPFKGVASL